MACALQVCPLRQFYSENRYFLRIRLAAAPTKASRTQVEALKIKLIIYFKGIKIYLKSV